MHSVQRYGVSLRVSSVGGGQLASVEARAVAKPPRAGGVEHRRQRLQVHGADALQQQLVPRLIEQLQHLLWHTPFLSRQNKGGVDDSHAVQNPSHVAPRQCPLRASQGHLTIRSRRQTTYLPCCSRDFCLQRRTLATTLR